MTVSAWTVYSNAAEEVNNGSFNLTSNTLVMCMLTTAYTPAPNTDSTWNNCSTYEVATGSGYTQGGVVLSGQSVSLTSATVTFTCTSPSWTTFAATFRFLVIARRAGGSLASTDLLLCYCDATGGGSITGGGGTFTVAISGSGIFTTTHNP